MAFFTSGLQRAFQLNPENSRWGFEQTASLCAVAIGVIVTIVAAFFQSAAFFVGLGLIGVSILSSYAFAILHDLTEERDDLRQRSVRPQNPYREKAKVDQERIRVLEDQNRTQLDEINRLKLATSPATIFAGIFHTLDGEIAALRQTVSLLKDPDREGFFTDAKHNFLRHTDDKSPPSLEKLRKLILGVHSLILPLTDAIGEVASQAKGIGPFGMIGDWLNTTGIDDDTETNDGENSLNTSFMSDGGTAYHDAISVGSDDRNEGSVVKDRRDEM